MRRHWPRAGFTLIEVLVVVVLISILMGIVVGTFTGTSREQVLLGFVERLGTRIEMARDKAVQTNHEWGIFVERDDIRFAEFDDINGEWIEKVARPFTRDPDAEGLEFTAEVEAYAATLGNDGDGDDEEEIPQIILFSSGEVTPFTLEVVPTEWAAPAWILKSDGFSRTERTRAELL